MTGPPKTPHSLRNTSADSTVMAGARVSSREKFTATRRSKPSEEYDEEADEYYESEWDVRYDVYISFWQDKNFRLMTEAELKG